jgi:hypothetical protein
MVVTHIILIFCALLTAGIVAKLTEGSVTFPVWMIIGIIAVLIFLIGEVYIFLRKRVKKVFSETKEPELLGRLIPKGEEQKPGYLLSKEVVYLGRDVKNDILLNDESVSRRHAQIVRQSEGFLLRDLGSKNGTFINNLRVEEQMLKNDDILTFGNLYFIFSMPPLPEPQQSESAGQEPTDEPSPHPAPPNEENPQ